MNRVNCLIYNYAQHYRLGIFRLLQNELDFDFYFGNEISDIRKIDYGELKNIRGELKNIKLPFGFYWQRGAIKLAFKKYSTFLILGEYYCLSTWIILLIAKLFKKRIYFWSHGWYGNEGKVKKIVKKIFFQLSDGVFLYGNYAKDIMLNEGISMNKLFVIYNSLDYDLQICIRRELKESTIFQDYFNNNNPVLIFIGRLTKVKKLDLLLYAVNHNNSRGVETNVVFIGDGEERDHLEILTKKLNLDTNVWFYGPCYNEQEIGGVIFNADICVSPGNVGLTAMHSLVYGTPVITHNEFTAQMPEFEVITRWETGAFFKKDDYTSLSDTILYWLNINKNRQVVRNKCFKVIDDFYNPNYQIKIFKQALC